MQHPSEPDRVGENTLHRGRRSWSLAPLVATALLTGLAPASAEPSRVPAAGSVDSTFRRIAEGYGRLPLFFEANRTQTDTRVGFLARRTGWTVFLTATEMVFDAGDDALLRMRLEGSNPRPVLSGLDSLASRSNYFLGNDRRRWITDVPHYARVRSAGVYPGVDLVYHGENGQLEYDFFLRPGADPGRIALRFDGADSVAVEEGELVVRRTKSEFRHRRPVVYEDVGGRRRVLHGAYVLRRDGAVGFRLAGHDPRMPLVIDPVLSYSTFLGGAGGDSGLDIAVDGGGNAYVTGRTLSANFPVLNPVQAGFGGGTPNGDVFVAKLNSTGTALLYATYLGGSGDEAGIGIAVDSGGHAVVTGSTRSTNFPVAAALQGTFGGDRDGFVAKLGPAGSTLVYSTYLGGSGSDSFSAIALDAAGSAYVAGTRPGTGLTVSTDAWVVKLNAAGNSLLYNVFFDQLFAGGISLNETIDGIALDSAGNAYAAGDIGLNSIGLRMDVLVVKVDPAGNILVRTLGGSDDDEARDVATDPAGNVYVGGFTESSDFPTTPGAFQATRPTGLNGDGIVVKLGPSGTVIYSTYLGGIDRDAVNGISVDAGGNACLVGFTSSNNFPLAAAFQTSYGGGDDAFVAQLNPAGSALLFATYLGGAQRDLATGTALDHLGNVYVTGGTSSTAFPTARALQAVKSGGEDGFVLRLGDFLGTVTLPAAASLHGAPPTFFHSDVRVFNTSSTAVAAVTARYRCFTGACGNAVQTFQVPPRQVRVFDDVIAALFGAPETGGAVEFETTGSIVVTSRLYTPTRPLPTYGMFISGSTDQEAYASAVLTSLSHSVDTSRGSRTNVGVFNPNDTAQTVTFSLYSDTGVPLGMTSQFVGARQALQVNNIFAVVGVAGDIANAYCVVRGNGTLKIFAYAAVLDNQSQDPIFVKGANEAGG